MAKSSIKGVDVVLGNLKKIEQNMPGQLEGALLEIAEQTMGRAKAITPVDTGALRASGHVREPRERRNRINVTLAFGGPAAGYAVFVHEGIEKRFVVGQAKFLEDPIMELSRTFLKDLQERISLRAASS